MTKSQIAEIAVFWYTLVMKNILITGVSRGIGKALAQKFLAENYTVTGTSTTGTSNIEHENLTVLPLDLSDTTSIVNCTKQILDQGKTFEILINNAGIYMEGFDDGPEVNIDTLRKTLEVNLIGQIDFTQRILSKIEPSGHIVNITSRMGSMDYTAGASDPAYRISKAGMNMVSRILAARLKDQITVTAVHPGSVQTDMGLPDAPMTPAEAAEDIYNIATSRPESGQFRFKDDQFPW